MDAGSDRLVGLSAGHYAVDFLCVLAGLRIQNIEASLSRYRAGETWLDSDVDTSDINYDHIFMVIHGVI